MSLLRRVLSLGAFLSLALSLPLLVIPGTVVETLLRQAPPSEEVWIRLLGAGGIAIGLFHVLILRKLDDLWWWCWTFVILDGLSAVIVIVHALVSLPDGSAAWPWWLYGATSTLFAGLYLGGIAKAGQEKPFV